jgi:hypothetical protein
MLCSRLWTRDLRQNLLRSDTHPASGDPVRLNCFANSTPFPGPLPRFALSPTFWFLGIELELRSSLGVAFSRLLELRSSLEGLGWVSGLGVRW